MDLRAAIHRADSLVRDERYAAAVDEYQAVADAYVEGGFALKAVAVLRQIVEIAPLRDVSPRLLRQRGPIFHDIVRDEVRQRLTAAARGQGPGAS